MDPTVLIIVSVSGIFFVEETDKSKTSGLSTVLVFWYENLVYFSKSIKHSLHVPLDGSVGEAIYLQC